jgi:hypothetical protein
MGKCPFVDRECTPECVAYDSNRDIKCSVLHMSDRTNRLLNFIEKKVDKK